MDSVQDFKNRDAASYDPVAANFDRHTEKYSTYVVDALLRKAGVETAARTIDIGCGTGVITLAAAKKVSAGGKIVGIDLSDGMLAFAGAKAAQLGLGERVEFLKCDAENLDIADESVDAAVSLYAFRHLPNPDKAAAEVFRVLRPGGRFAVAVGSGPSLFSFAGVEAAMARLPRAIARASGRELSACDQLERLVEAHLPPAKEEEIAGWAAHHHGFSGSMATLLKKAGFDILSSGWMGREFVASFIEDFWDLQATFSSIARKRIAEAGADEITALKSAFQSECEAVLGRGGRLVYRVGAAIVDARKPG